MLWVGHFDLTQSLGIPGQFDHDLFHDALRRVVDTARRHGPELVSSLAAWLRLRNGWLSASMSSLCGGDLYVYLALAQSVADVRQIAFIRTRLVSGRSLL